MLYWPFIHHRESWDIISIIDPIFTLPILLGLALAFFLRTVSPARWAVGISCAYLFFGIVQRERAENYLENLAEERGHTPEMVSVRPSFANLVLWRLIYREGDQYYVSAVNLTPFKQPEFFPGDSAEAFTRSDAREVAPEGSTLADDIERFRFFSQGYLFIHPEQKDAVADLRYAMFPDSLMPLWGIRVDPSAPDEHVSMEYFRKASPDAFSHLWGMITGNDLRRD